jgi:hypothetical protein
MTAAAGIAGALALLGAAAPAFAQGQCVDLCAVSCAKPISIPDRWDDVTPIAGYTGAMTKEPNWRGNAQWNSEAITNDVNGNGLYDPGDGYTDGNGNGAYDAEAYDPTTTGYNAGPSALAPGGDLGAEITLTNALSVSLAPGQYFAIDYPPVNKGTPRTDLYLDNWSLCNAGIVGAGDDCQVETSTMVGPTNQAMRDLIAQDADAYWDPVTASVQGSLFTQSPRVIFFPVHDPRIPIHSGSNLVVITKVVAFFMDHMTGSAIVQGRFMRALGTGETCATGGAGFIVECPTPARATSWGRVKDLYR